MMKTNKHLDLTKNLFCVVAVAGMLAGPAGAELITTDLGDRGDGYNVVRFSYSNSGVNTGTWTVPPGVTTVQVLVVGGGGSGSAGINYKWGGGGGGLIDLNSYTVTPGASLTVTVGIGGASANGNNPGRVGNAGGQSQFGTLIAYGGAGGGTSTGGTSGTNNYNSAGGLSSSTRGGSGVGLAATDTYGTGGNGLTSTIISSTFASTKSLPYDQGYYGGGGAGYPPTQGGATVFGGLGGGGDITDTSGDSTGLPGLDGLGGGGAGSSGARASGAGGDGAIYVAYTTAGLNDYDDWNDLYEADLSDKEADFDGDGVTNFQEFAFGLDPTSGASANPITDTSNLETLSQFSYTRNANSGLTYTIWTSVDLIDWDEAVGSVQEPGEADEFTGVQTVLVEVNPMPGGNKVFIRVKAE